MSLAPYAGNSLSYTGATVVKNGILVYQAIPTGAPAIPPSKIPTPPSKITVKPDSGTAELDTVTGFTVPVTLDSTNGSTTLQPSGSFVGDVTLTGSNNTFNVLTDTTFSGSVQGTGGLTKDGSGTATLAPANNKKVSYTGATIIEAGELVFSSGTITSPITLTNSGTSSVGQLGYGSQTFFQNITFRGGNLDPNAGSLNLALGAIITTTVDTPVTNNIILNGATTFTLGTADQPAALTLSGVLSGPGGLTVNGPGMLHLSNDNTYTGNTLISSGAWLNLGCSLTSDVTVDDGATFSSDGTIGTLSHFNTLKNNGIVQPMFLNADGTFNIGTLTVNGDYTQTNTGILAIPMLDKVSNDVGFSSLLNVTGTASLSGAVTFSLASSGSGAGYTWDPTDPQLTGATYIILKAGESITGFFTQEPLTAVSSSMPGFNFQVVGPMTRMDGDPGQEVRVILHPQVNHSTLPSTVTLSPTILTSTTTVLSNQISKSTNSQNTSTINAPTEGPVTDDNALGSSSAGKGDNPVEDADSFRARTSLPIRSQPKGLFQPSGARYHSSQGWGGLLSRLDQNGSINLGKSDGRDGKLDSTLWITPVYTQGRSKQTATTGASSDFMQLLLGGMEWENPETKHLFGISLGGGLGETKSRALSANRSHHKALQASLYHSMRWDEIRWDAFLTANRMFNRNRRVANASTGYIIPSSSITDTLGASTEISYKGNLGNLLVLRPYYGLDYWYIIQHRYREEDNSIYSQSHAQIAAGGLDHYIGAALRKTWLGIGNYSIRVEGDLWYSLILKDPNLVDTIYAVTNNVPIRTQTVGDYGRGTLSPSLTLSAMNQETGTKYFISGSATIQNKRTSYQLLLKASIPLN